MKNPGDSDALENRKWAKLALALEGSDEIYTEAEMAEFWKEELMEELQIQATSSGSNSSNQSGTTITILKAIQNPGDYPAQISQILTYAEQNIQNQTRILPLEVYYTLSTLSKVSLYYAASVRDLKNTNQDTSLLEAVTRCLQYSWLDSHTLDVLKSYIRKRSCLNNCD